MALLKEDLSPLRSLSTQRILFMKSLSLCVRLPPFFEGRVIRGKQLFGSGLMYASPDLYLI